MTTTYRHAVRIDRDAAEVFAYVTDPLRLGDWQHSIVGVRRLSGPPTGLGCRVEEVRHWLGRAVTSRWTVTAYEPPRTAAVTIEDGPLEGEACYLLTPLGAATHLVFELELRAIHLPAGLRRAGGHAARSLLAADAQRLRTRLELPRPADHDPAVVR